jgi:hypothetical protein
MTEPKRWIFVALCSAFACVSPPAPPGTSSYDYTTSAAHEVPSERLIGEASDVVWRRLVGRLADSPFVINAIEKESRVISLSFSTDHPERYVDCGRSKREYAY